MITFVDGQAVSATQLNTAFVQKMDTNADGSTLTSLAGSGPTARTLGSRFADNINVLDYLTALPDGLTDNTTQIQAAINASANKANVVLPKTAFPYRVSGLLLQSNVHLILNGTLFLVNNSSLSVLRGTNLSNVVIEGNGTIDGNRAGQTGARHGIEIITVDNLVISDITVQNCFLSPINVSAGASTLLDHCTLKASNKAVQFAAASSNVWLRNCTISNVADNGLSFYGGCTTSGIVDCTINTCTNSGILVYHDATSSVGCNNIVIEGNIIYSNGGNGINIDKGAGAVGNHSNLLISSNRIYSNNTSNTSGFGGIKNNSGVNVQIAANQISKNGSGANPSYGISVAGSNTQVLGNQIVNEAQGSVLGVGIFLATSANNVLVQSNQILDDQGVHTMQYGLAGACGVGCRLYNNSIAGMISSKYSNLVFASDTIGLETNDLNVLTAIGLFATTGAICDLSTVVVNPVTAFTNTIPNGCSTYLMVPAGTLANGTVTMPPVPAQGQQLNILTSQPITNFSLVPNSGETVLGAPSSLNGNTGLSFIYNGTTWYCISAAAGTSSIGPLAVRVVTLSGAITATTTDQLLVVNKTVGANTAVTLPASPPTGMAITVKDGKGDAGTHPIVITPSVGTIDGASNVTISSNYAAVDLVYTGSNTWSIH